MNKKQIVEYNKIRWDIEDLLFKQQHRQLTEQETIKLKELETLRHNFLK